jgi:aspartyl-tRNA(Asn)/glutamyl-tRNA(Gln) amidotransferase subunit A
MELKSAGPPASEKPPELFSFRTIRHFNDFLAANPEGCRIAVEHYLARIDQSGNLNAFLEVFGDEALARARQLDQKRKSGQAPGKLQGVVIAIKDVIAYQGHTLSAASKMLDHFTSLYHATVLERLLAEEAIIIGRTNCDEFAMGSSNENSAFGVTRNALDTNRVPGGSSGGSAVAVQAGLCMVSLGSDTGGSVRQPADFCGILGFKPSYGRISRHGLIAYGSSFDQIGLFGQSVEDITQVLEVIGGPDGRDFTASSQPLPPISAALRQDGKNSFRIAYFRQALEHPGLDPEIRERFLQCMESLRQSGNQVEPVDFEYLDYIVPAYYILSTAEASSNLARYDGVRYGRRALGTGEDPVALYRRSRSEGFGREVKRRILLGTFVLSSGYQEAYFTRAQQVRRLLVDHTKLIFNKFDVICLPVSPVTAFRFGERMDDPVSMYLADIYTVYANLTGIPAFSLPLFRHSNGMPFGMQAMTDRFKELPLCLFSHLLMQQ